MSALFAGLAITLFLAVYLREVFVRIIAPILSALLYGYLCTRIGSLQVWQALPETWPFPLWRAVAGLCLGSFAYLLYERLRGIRLTAAGRIVSAAIKCVLAVGILAYAGRTWAQRGVLDFAVPPMSAVLFAMLLGDGGDSCGMLQKPACSLGRICLPLWLNHSFVIEMFLHFGFKGGFFEAYFSIVAASVLMAWLAQVAVAAIERLCVRGWCRWRDKLIEN